MLVICIGGYRNIFYSTSVGLSMFTTVMWTNYFFITAAAIGYFSTLITEEKEEETLGLLRMAGISPLCLLLGKSCSRLSLALVLLSIQFPFALLSVTLGGVTLRQVTACYMSLAVYMFFLSGMATLCSVTNRRSMRAVVYMVVATLFLFFLSRICDGVQDLVDYYCPVWVAERVEWWLDWTIQLSMSSRLTNVLTTTFDDPLIDRHFIASAVAGTLFYLLSWLLFDFFAYRQTDKSTGRSQRKLLRSIGLTAGRTWPTAIVWKDFYFGTGGIKAWLLRIVLLSAVVGAISWLAWRADRQNFAAEDIGNILFPFTILFTVIELMIHSLRFISDERNQKTLPLLAMLPWSNVRTLFSKLVGLMMGTVPYVAAFVLALYLAPDMMENFFSSMSRGWSERLGFLYFFLIFPVFFALNAFLSSYVKWAAAPLSFGILFAFTMCCLFVFRTPGGREAKVIAMLFAMNVVACMSIAVLALLVGKRFEMLRGE